VRNTAVGDAAIPTLATLPRLHSLDISETRISTSGAVSLIRDAPNLQSIGLDAAQLDDASIRALGDREMLVELSLYGRGVVNTTIERLRALQELRELNLLGTSITDESVPLLASMMGLRSLRLTPVLSKPALASLRSLRSDIRIALLASSIARSSARRSRGMARDLDLARGGHFIEVARDLRSQ
jgi:hypothetical protein